MLWLIRAKVKEGEKRFYSFILFSAPPSQPIGLEQYITTDEPLLSLHVTSFNDAMFVSITFPHELADGTAAAGLVKTLSTVALGQLDQVPPILGAANDVLEPVRGVFKG